MKTNEGARTAQLASTPIEVRTQRFLRAVQLVLVMLAAVLFLTRPVSAAESIIYVTADNLNGTNLFGTLDLKTGRFTEIAQTTQLFYALTTGPGGRLYGADINTGAIFSISHTGAVKPYGSIVAPGFYGGPYYGFLGMVGSAREDDFLAVNVDPQYVSLYSVTKHGDKATDLGVIEGPNTGIYFAGSLTVGPYRKLYFDFVPPSGAQLFTVDPRNGKPTAIGKGLGTDILALFSDGTTLYGIDADTTTDIGIYVIDPKSGVAMATGATVTGLPDTNDFYIDTLTFSSADEARCE